VADGASRPRLLFVVNVAWFFTSHRLPLALAAMRRGYEVHVAATVEGPDEAEPIRRAGIVFHELRGARGAAGPLADAAMLVDVLRTIRRVRPQVVHAVTAKPIMLAGFACRLLRVPVFIGALTGLGYLYIDQSRNRLLRALVSRAMAIGLAPRSARLIVQNAHDAELLIRAGVVDRRQLVLIPGSGVDVDEYAECAEPAGVPAVILPARMLLDKGVIEFCEAAAAIRAQGIEARFALVGGLDPRNPAAIDEPRLRELCARTGVEWWGHRRDMRDIYAASHVVCLPSYREGLPKCLLEAGATGRAIVTTDVPGCRDVVTDGVDGLVVPVRDASTLATALARVIRDADLRRHLGAAAARRVREQFDVRLVIDRTLSLYEAARVPLPRR
jgi:glycosyltransferase involved in cell wall biosynthesis